MLPLICIEGPTASGKSDLALALAKILDTEIISADSRQVYKYLNIGTAKPTLETLTEVQHHLIDIIDPDQRYSAGAFIKDAEKIIENILAKGKVPIVCGGTMLYIKSLLEGLSDIPDIVVDVKNQVTEFMTQNSLDESFNFVKSIDEKFANSISPTDKQRISRALEVWFAFKTPLTKYWETQEQINKYLVYKIYIDRPREDLYFRINTRMSKMIKDGLIEEIEQVFKLGYSPDDYGLNSVGYKEFLDIITTKQTSDSKKMEECIALAAQHTRNYAKRQITWYKKSNFEFAISQENINISIITEKIKKYLKI